MKSTVQFVLFLWFALAPWASAQEAEPPEVGQMEITPRLLLLAISFFGWGGEVPETGFGAEQDRTSSKLHPLQRRWCMGERH
jgi:hypothetical protein